MKTKYLYIGNSSVIVNKLRYLLNDVKLVVEQFPLSAVKFLNENLDINVILFEATNGDKEKLELVQFFRENIHHEIVFFLIYDSKQYFFNRTVDSEKYLKQGIDDVFFIDTDTRFLKKGADSIAKRIAFLNKNRIALRTKKHVRQKSFRIPFWKRTFDILFSSLAIIFLTPIFLLIAVAIRIESKGKVYYTSKRVGTGYKIFNFYKFRSMLVDADKNIGALMNKNQYASSDKGEVDNEINKEVISDVLLVGEGKMIFEQDFLEKKGKKQEASFFKVSNDPRITKVGRFIRNTSLDELLQLFNILKGDMSVVGNRPLPIYEAEVLTTDKWINRFLAPAGLTGLWQVTKRARSSEMSPKERKQLDLDYSDHYSFFSDLRIILQTIPALLQHEDV